MDCIEPLLTTGRRAAAGRCAWLALALCAMLPAYPAREPWKERRPAEWTEEDARLVLAASPWTRSVNPRVKGNSMGTASVGLGPAYGRRGVITGGPDHNYAAHPLVSVRWESAEAVREAQRKSGAAEPSLADRGYYAIAVDGVQTKFAGRDARSLGREFQKHAALKREGHPDLKPERVEVILRDSGLVAVFLFARSAGLRAEDRQVVFEAQIGPLYFSETFALGEMLLAGKLDL